MPNLLTSLPAKREPPRSHFQHCRFPCDAEKGQKLHLTPPWILNTSTALHPGVVLVLKKIAICRNNVLRRAEWWCSWFWGCPKGCWREAGEDGVLLVGSAEEPYPSLMVMGETGRYHPALARPPKSALENASVYYLLCIYYRSQTQTCPNLTYNNISFNRQQTYINIYLVFVTNLSRDASDICSLKWNYTFISILSCFAISFLDSNSAVTISLASAWKETNLLGLTMKRQKKPSKNKPMSVAGHWAHFMDQKVQAQEGFEQKGLCFTSLLLIAPPGKQTFTKLSLRELGGNVQRFYLFLF